ncbi:hypothetical protein WGE86_21245, partial [Xanthomonas euvesicatoria pv. euvesicatoria]|uniref:hypothetical protein n=1 Tax=Xanthomonas euvesicatoria TaxID=456327 RepID=UPI0032B524EF
MQRRFFVSLIAAAAFAVAATSSSAAQPLPAGARSSRVVVAYSFTSKPNWSPLKNPSQTSSAMFADHMVLEGVEERARTTCNQARKNAIQRS